MEWLINCNINRPNFTSCYAMSLILLLAYHFSMNHDKNPWGGEKNKTKANTYTSSSYTNFPQENWRNNEKLKCTLHVHSLRFHNTVVSGTMYVNTSAKDIWTKTLPSRNQLGNKSIFTCAGTYQIWSVPNGLWSSQHWGRLKFTV